MIHDLRYKNKLAIFVSVFFLLFIATYSLLTTTAYAVCPVCTIAVGAGLGVSRALGIDDAVTSVWIGGLILSMSFWMIDWLDKKKFKFMNKFYEPKVKLYSNMTIILLMYVITLVPLWMGKFIGRFNNRIFEIDKILFGTIAGSIVFLFGMWVDRKVRKIKGQQLFVYQKVVFPVTALLLTSILLELIVRNI